MRLIDADALLDELVGDYNNFENVPHDVAAMYEAVMEQPTIEAEHVRHGRWVFDRLVTTSGGTYGVRRCLVCEAYYQDIDDGWNYCPNCGARMDGGE